MEKTQTVSLQKSILNPQLSFLLGCSFSVLCIFFKNKIVKKYFKFFDLLIVILCFSDKSFARSKLCSVSNDAVQQKLNGYNYSYLFAFKRFSCSTEYTLLKTLSRLDQV